ncbi:hypothetical protein Tco_1267276 [Tanacetum coccineum]
MAHLRNAIMEEHRVSMEAYRKVHNETVRSRLRMAIVQQSMEMDMWEIKEKLVERQEQLAIRAYEEEKRRAEFNQKIEEDKRREAWNQKIEEDKKRKEWNQKIEEMINLILSFIQNPISSVKTPQRVTTKRKKRKGHFVCTKSKSRVVIEVGQTKAIEGGLNCDNRLANYEQPCQHFLIFDYDPQEGEDPGITGKIMEQHLEDKDIQWMGSMFSIKTNVEADVAAIQRNQFQDLGFVDALEA